MSDNPFIGMTRDEYIRAIQGQYGQGVFQPETIQGNSEGDEQRLGVNDPRHSGQYLQGGNWYVPQFGADGNVAGIGQRESRAGRIQATAGLGLAGVGAAGLLAGGAAAGSAAGGGGAASGGAASTAGTAGAVGGAGSLAGGIDEAVNAGSTGAGDSTFGNLTGALGDFGLNPGTALGALAGGLGAASDPNSLRGSSQTSIDGATRGHLNNYLNAAQNQVGQTNYYTNQAAEQIGGLAGDNSQINAANSANQGMMANGGYNAMAGSNPFLADGGRNSYSGQNPYLDRMISDGVGDLARGHGRIGQSNDAFAARNNAFGGSAWQRMNQDNQRAFGESAGRYVNNARFGDYQMQAGLDESRLGRQQNAYNTSAGLEENRLGRQQNAIGMAPGLNSARFTGANQLANVGNQQFGQQQATWGNYANSMAPALSGATRSTQTTGANPNASNPWSSALGGAMLGQQLWRDWNK